MKTKRRGMRTRTEVSCQRRWVFLCRRRKLQRVRCFIDILILFAILLIDVIDRGLDGSRQFTMSVDATATGSNFVQGTITKNGVRVSIAPVLVITLTNDFTDRLLKRGRPRRLFKLNSQPVLHALAVPQATNVSRNS